VRIRGPAGDDLAGQGQKRVLQSWNAHRRGTPDCPYREVMELAPTDAERRYLAERLRELDLAT
jgi:hypothetical protein